MKNNKGFTLVEVLAVVALLAIIMIIAVPNIMDSLNSANNKIGELEKNNLVDGIETVALEVLNCEFPLSDYNYLFTKSVTTCKTMQDDLLNSTLETTVAKLKEKGYFEDPSSKCNGTVQITTNSSTYKVTVNHDNVECKK